MLQICQTMIEPYNELQVYKQSTLKEDAINHLEQQGAFVL